MQRDLPSPAARHSMLDTRYMAVRLACAASLVFVCLGVAAAQALQKVNGRVVDGTSMQPIASAVVQVGPQRAVTDRDGRFELRLPRGTARLTVTANEYLADQLDVTIGDTQATIEVLLLSESQFKEDVFVTAAATAAARPPAAIEVSPLQVRSIAGAAENVFHALQTLPGVNATADFDSRLSVRGGGPDQNLTIMDGVEIHNPYRLFGLTSAFNPETVENFELTSGGFSAEHGDRLSSLLLIENRPGTRSKAFTGSLFAGLTDANVILEGKLPGDMKGAWLFTGRRTYYDLVANRITDQTLPAFGDLQARSDWEMRPGKRLTLFALRSRETTDARFDSSSSGSNLGLTDTARNDLVSLSLLATIGTSASSRTIVSWYRYGDDLAADGSVRNESARSNAPGDEAFAQNSVAFSRVVGVRDASVRQELAVKAGAKQLVEAGFELHALSTSWSWRIAGDRNLSEANGSSARGGSGLPSTLDSVEDSSRVGAWLTDRYQPTARVVIEPGLRFDWSSLAREAVVSPRLAATIALGGGFRVRAATGLFTQSPGYEKLLQSDYFVDLTSSSESRLKSERSVHVLGAVEREFGGGITGRVEAYYKSFNRLIVGRLETPAEAAARASLYAFPPELASSVPAAPQITSLPTNGASGRAYGFDVYVARRAPSSAARLAGWASYTWGRADRDAYGRRAAFEYDRRHALSLVSSYRLTRLIELAASARVASGFPYTPVIGLRVAAQQVADASGNIIQYVPQQDAQGLYVWTTDLGDVTNLNTSRLPVFGRVDVRVTFRPTWSGSRWQFYLEAINVLNRKNASILDPSLEYNPAGDRPALTYSPGGSLPFLPSFGIRVRF